MGLTQKIREAETAARAATAALIETAEAKKAADVPAEPSPEPPIVVKFRCPFEEFAPSRKTPGASGWDLFVANKSQFSIRPGTGWQVRTGVSVQIPEGYEGQLRLRSSVGAKGLILANGVGTIDSDYRGEIIGFVWNVGDSAQVITPGERLFQLVIAPVPNVVFLPGDLDETARGEGGFGSTGR